MVAGNKSPGNGRGNSDETKTILHLDSFVKWLMALMTLIVGAVLTFWVLSDFRRNEARDAREQLAIESIPIIKAELAAIRELFALRIETLANDQADLEKLTETGVLPRAEIMIQSARLDIGKNKTEIEAQAKEVRALNALVLELRNNNRVLQTMIKAHARHERSVIDP